MSAPTRSPRPQFTKAAAADVHRIAEVDRGLAEQALRLAIDIHDGRATGAPLNERGKTGDLSDCFKAPFGHEVDRPSHHLVYRLVGDGVEVVEVVAVGPREQDVAYLLAGLRLGRIADEKRRSLAERIVFRALNP